MNKLHCDKCDKVIEGLYYEIKGRNTNIIADCLPIPESLFREICSDCFNKIMEEENDT